MSHRIRKYDFIFFMFYLSCFKNKTVDIFFCIFCISLIFYLSSAFPFSHLLWTYRISLATCMIIQFQQKSIEVSQLIKTVFSRFKFLPNRKWSERSEREEMNVAVTYDENVELYLIHQYQKDQMLLWFFIFHQLSLLPSAVNIPHLSHNMYDRSVPAKKYWSFAAGQNSILPI